MKKLWKNHVLGKQYIRYLLSYVAVLLIPLVILTGFYSSRFMKKFYGEIYETVDLELMQLGTQLENEWSSMQNIVGQLTLTDTIRQVAVADSALDLAPTITYLSGFCSANPFIKDMALIADGQDYVVTSSTTCERDYYFRRIVQLSDLTGHEFSALLNDLVAPVCLPSQEILHLGLGPTPEKMALFSFPVFTDYQKRAGTVLFFVSDSSLKNLLNQKFQSYQAQIYILDSNETLITTSGSNPDAIDAGPAEYIVRSYESPKNLWSCLAFLPNRAATFSQVSAILREFMLAIIIIIVLACFVITFLQRVNYAPVHQLREKARRISPEGTSSDEMATISNALDYLSLQNTSLTDRLKGSVTAVKDERLYRLISGSYNSREDFNLDCCDLELSLPYEYFSVSIMMIHGQTMADLDSLVWEIREHISAPYLYYCLHNFHPNQIVFLANLQKPAPPTDHYLKKVKEYLLKSHDLLATIGTGSLTNNTERIAQSYMEAVSALDYRFVKGNGTLIRFQEVLGSTRTPMIYPHQEFDVLHNALLSRNEQNILTSIRNIIGFLEQNQVPLYLARSVCFDLIHMVNQHCQETKISPSSSPLVLSGMETAREIIKMLQDWSEQFNGLSLLAAEKASIHDVLAYIEANCLRCDFSAYETAEYFGMTLPAFSKFFKDATGQNVMDHTIYLRIQKAKELLSSTDLPLKDISEQVGYYNVSSFTRRFKLNQGVTPSEYRKINRL